MVKYLIASKAGGAYGIYEGGTAEEAFDAMVADGGGEIGGPTVGTAEDWIISEAPDDAVMLDDRAVSMRAARALMDDELCEQIHGTVSTEQAFLDAYLVAHRAKYGEDFVVN